MKLTTFFFPFFSFFSFFLFSQVNDFKQYCELYFAPPEPKPEDEVVAAEEEDEDEDEEDWNEGGKKKKKKKATKKKKKELGPINFVHERLNERWEICIGMSGDQQAQQVSFCNSICTIKGGEHVKYIADEVAKKIIPLAKKQFKGLEIKNSQFKNSMFVFINCLISNPSFDSQTKETLTTRHTKFGPAKFKPTLEVSRS